MSKRQKYTFVFSFLAIVVTIFFLPSVTHAQVAEGTFTNGILSAFTKFFLALASLAIQLAIFFLKFFILVAGYNGYISADIVKFGWNIVRDVANMFFIVVLLVIAFGTILGLEQYEWKKSLPKLVFAAIFVNFSNVICQIIIDVSQVFTITFLNAVAGTAGGNLISIMKFDTVFSLLKTSSQGGTRDIIGDLLIGSFFAVFFCFIAAASIGSYLIVMLYRMVTLWCLIILSPLAFLFSILPSTKGYAEEFWREFIQHVIAAPMMVFFLWLAFATFGAGDIVETNIQNPDNNSIARQGFSLDSDAQAVGEQTGVTISEAASWMNLANFAVAIAFLYIGIERVQKLGVQGGDYIQRGMDFGKRAFNIAAGIELARWGHGKGKSALGSAAGFAADKIPLVGRDSLVRYGKSVKGWGGTKLNRFRITRDEFAVNKGDKIKEALGGGFLGGVAGRAFTGMFQSNARAEKLAKNWERAAEDSAQRWDEEVSTSKTASGKAKLTEGVKLEIAQDVSSQKKRQKFADERDRLINQGGKFQNLVNEAGRTSVKADLMEHKLHAQADEIKEEFKGKLLGALSTNGEVEEKDIRKYTETENASLLSQDRTNKIKSLTAAEESQHAAHIDVANRERMSNILERASKSTADTEEIKKEIARKSELSVSRNRDALLIAAGKIPRYVEQSMAKFQKEDQELAGNSSYDRVQGKIQNIINELNSGNISADREKTLRNELAQLQTFNVNRGAIFGVGGIEKVANSINENGERVGGVNSNDVVTAQAKVLSGLTGKLVEASEESVNNALSSLERQFADPEKYLAFMRSFKDGLEKSADEGAVNFAGLFKEVVQADGSSIFKATNMREDSGHINGKRAWAAGQSNFNKITSFSGAVDTIRKQDGSEVVDASTEAARENLTKIFSKVTQNVANGINDGVIGDWNALIQNMNTSLSGQLDLKDLLASLKKDGNQEGLNAMFKRTDEQTKRILEELGHRDLVR